MSHVTVLSILIVTAGPPFMSALCFLWLPLTRNRDRFWVSWVVTGLTEIVIAAIYRQWLVMAAALAGTAIAAILWWLSRRRRKRAPRAYGAKSRALLAALVRRAREAAVPRPVLRPVPEGSPA
jgi:hypothetical protein